MPLLLREDTVDRILTTIPRLRIAVLGDLFLDRYLDLDANLTEPSLETGLDAYQVVRVRSYPGAAGTVVNNLVALGVGQVLPIAVIGDDGEGYELRQALGALRGVDSSGVFSFPGRRTPTYTKPMLLEAGQPPRELNRLDIHNRSRLPPEAENRLLTFLQEHATQLDGLVVLDQVSHAECGVVTTTVREQLAATAKQSLRCPILADSRERIGLFRGVNLKPNLRECRNAVALSLTDNEMVMHLSRQAGAAVFCTRGENGILLARPDEDGLVEVPAYPVAGPTDPVGAGDSTSAGIICALASGLPHETAAAFGNLIASITVQQIGTTGTATPQLVRQRMLEIGVYSLGKE